MTAAVLVQLAAGLWRVSTASSTSTSATSPKPAAVRADADHAAARSASDWLHLGVQQEGQGYFNEAEASYREALRVGGPEAKACFGLANVLAVLGHTEIAIERYRQAVEIEPAFAEALNNLGTLYANAGSFVGGMHAFRQAIASRTSR